LFPWRRGSPQKKFLEPRGSANIFFGQKGSLRRERLRNTGLDHRLSIWLPESLYNNFSDWKSIIYNWLTFLSLKIFCKNIILFWYTTPFNSCFENYIIYVCITFLSLKMLRKKIILLWYTPFNSCFEKYIIYVCLNFLSLNINIILLLYTPFISWFVRKFQKFKHRFLAMSSILT
jgi:hypothetical protein